MGRGVDLARELRRTGRTTRMLSEVCGRARNGERVILVVAAHGRVQHIVGVLVALGAVRKPIAGSWSFTLGAGEIEITKGDAIDWRRMQAIGVQGRVIADHQAIEEHLHDVWAMLHRYDPPVGEPSPKPTQEPDPFHLRMRPWPPRSWPPQ